MHSLVTCILSSIVALNPLLSMFNRVLEEGLHPIEGGEANHDRSPLKGPNSPFTTLST